MSSRPGYRAYCLASRVLPLGPRRSPPGTCFDRDHSGGIRRPDVLSDVEFGEVSFIQGDRADKVVRRVTRNINVVVWSCGSEVVLEDRLLLDFSRRDEENADYCKWTWWASRLSGTLSIISLPIASLPLEIRSTASGRLSQKQYEGRAQKSG
jgi:hypothetical protein